MIKSKTVLVTLLGMLNVLGRGLVLTKQRSGPIAVGAELELKADENPVSRNREIRDVILQSDRKKGTPRVCMRF